jgi:oxygen-independent coproporphyrinogen-3 oxidase
MSQDPATRTQTTRKTEVGSVFVSNYPPYSFWTGDGVDAALAALEAPPRDGVDLGVYVHVPFCRKRCKFCYFKVYTDKNAGEVERYLDAVGREVDAMASKPAIAGRKPTFLYVGGGTPSYISSKHLRALFDRIGGAIPLDATREITFECEPGTLTEKKVHTIRDVGVTRLSLGVEHFEDAILEENGRAHLSHEIYRCLPWVRSAGFAQLNVDLIAGMVGETWDTWREAVRKTIDLGPDSVTIYQMELPYNTRYSKAVMGGQEVPVADWDLKREWHDWAIETFREQGFAVSSAYTLVRERDGRKPEFVYRDSVWRGADLLPLGVSSFGHIGGVHYQNASSWERYLEKIESGEPAAERAYATSERERLIRETILQLKEGGLRPGYFRDKYDVSVVDTFAEVWDGLQDEGFVERADEDVVRLTRAGLLRVDSLLPRFYDPAHRDARYT